MRIVFVIEKVEFSIPLGIAYLLGMLNCDTKIVEMNKEGVREIKRFRPHIVAYSVISGRHNLYLDFNRYLKQQLSFRSVFGGPHPTFFPEMIEEEFVDAVCIGEGEKAFKEFVEGKSSLNFWIRDGNRIFKNPLHPLAKDLDTLPFPDRKLFYRFLSIREHGIKHFIAHRGCPYKCTYCFNKAFNELYGTFYYRSRRPEKICEEINYERTQTKIKMVGFVDDVFTLDKQWVKDFSKVYRKEVRLPFSINARFDNLDEETVSLLKEANCVLVYAGIESGNDFVRNTILKRQMSEQTICKGAELLKKHGIKLIAENIIGIPGESFQMALETWRLNIRIKPDFANCSFCHPYPKVELAKGFDNFDKLNIDLFHPLNKDRKMAGLRYFFSLITKHPWLMFLIHFPIKRLGDLLDGFYLKKCLSYKMGLIETVKNAFYYFQRYRRK